MQHLYKTVNILIIHLLLPIWIFAQNNTVVFSPSGGIYTDVFPVTLTCQNPNLQIRYTLNGSTPDKNALLYSNPLILNAEMHSKSDIYKIQNALESEFYLPDSIIKAVVIRAAAFDNAGNRVGAVITQSYFVSALGCDMIGLPVVSICTDSLSLFDYDTGIFVPGRYLSPIDTETTGNYMQRGIEWERLVNVEFYAEDNGGFNQLAGLRTHGGSRARRAQQKGLKLYAREEYGKKNFKCRIFPELEIEKFKHLVIRPFRNSCNPAGIHNWLANQLAAPLNMGHTSTRPVSLFLNGEYWGIYFIEERPDERYIESHFGVDHDSVNLINCWADLECGSNYSWDSLYKALKTADLSDPAQYNYFSRLIDIPNFIDYYVFELFTANWDWPANNVRCWQRINGPWHWIFFDGDCCLDYLDMPIYENATYTGDLHWPTCNSATLFFRRLLENPTFREMFIRRLKEVNNTYFQYSKTKPFFDKCRLEIKDEIPRQSYRFNNPQSMEEWELHCHTIDNFLCRREDDFWYRTKLFFNINEEEQVKGFVCYPNPLSKGEQLNVWIDAENEDVVKISIYDINGLLVHDSQNVMLHRGANLLSVDVPLTSGLYIVKVGDKKAKVIIQ